MSEQIQTAFQDCLIRLKDVLNSTLTTEEEVKTISRSQEITRRKEHALRTAIESLCKAHYSKDFQISTAYLMALMYKGTTRQRTFRLYRFLKNDDCIKTECLMSYKPSLWLHKRYIDIIDYNKQGERIVLRTHQDIAVQEKTATKRFFKMLS